MKESFVLAVGFGIVAIASAFLVPLWGRVALIEEKRGDHRFKVVSWALMVGSIGLFILAINRSLIELFHHSLSTVLLVIGMVFLASSKIALMSGSAIGADRKIVGWFLAICILWIAFCVAVETL